jgi:hypothetical protein
MSAFAPYKSMHDISQIGIRVETKMKDDQRYNALRNLDNQSDSSTEVGDWEAEVGIEPQRMRSQAIWQRLKRYRWMLDTTLLLIVVGLLIEKRWRHRQGHQYEFAGDITGFAPECRFM